ncbi:LOW QUALITY PROTEIN: tudor domain-containing protein 1 [Scomber scombrus]|uniref:Tudor domain-containing protein 1 n=1 Tax=Scomber scombrus TaxID=13677 RepID=A0AAV1PRQ3_SCOSC
MLTAAAMKSSFSPNLVRPNLPLRKPSSSPMALCTASLTMSAATPVRPAASAIGDGPINLPPMRDKSAMLGSMPPALTVYFCNYCGQQGNFRCKRCKKTPYCSVVCQTEDWKAHRHLCKPLDSEPVKEKANETTTSPVIADKALLVDSKQGDASNLQRVYLKDLQKTKSIKGADFEATVLEFYSPGRFFLIAQSPELINALQCISTELQKTYICPSVTTHVPSGGEVCAVQFSTDLNWYRGLVQTLAADQKTAKVLYIDFGNEENVPVDRIRPLATNIQPFCPCAMECRIAGVVPVTGTWSGECCIALRQQLAGKTFTAKVVETQENGRIHAVDILLSMGKQLSTMLLEHGYAAEETVSVAPTEQEISDMMNASFDNFRRCSDGKDANTWAQPPEPLTQAVGDSFTVVVTHFQSPNDIVVQKVENAGVIQELQLKLREHCCQVAEPQNFRPAPGTVCCAQFSEDKQWYRAKVLAYSSEERVCVGYLDFGNSEEVDLGQLQPISTSLLALPMQAMPCGLAGVQPVGESWSEECLLALQRRVSNRILRIEIHGAQEGKALVAMIDEASDPQGNVTELLISAGYAVPAPINSSGDQQPDQTTAPPATAEPHVSPPVSERLVWSSAELPSEGQTVALLASVVENPGGFFCRIDNPTDHQRLIELGAELKLHCESDASPFVPKVGEPCCAMFPGDGAWYRVMVKEQSEHNVVVYFVDYGYSMKMDEGHLRSIKPQLLTLPFQAIRCWLTGVEPLGSEWSSEALLWFQTRMDGEQLSACVRSVTEQGYGVELESRGQNVAAALIAEQLAKVPGEIPKETHTSTASGGKQQEGVKENDHSQIQVQVSNQTGNSKEIPTNDLPVAAPSAPSFPMDWKTTELPLKESFQPYIAAVTSPSLFYLIGPSQVDQQKLQEVMMELAAYCSNNQASLSSNVQSKLAPGAACCAQFSADNNWYRAVVLEASENEMSVIYADYANTEKVPRSRILPIPTHLLKLPFQITRCTLTGKERFPAEWPEEVQQIFKSLLMNGVLATVQSFDGSANILSLTLPAEKGGGNLTSMILDELQAKTKSTPFRSNTVKTDKTESCTSSTSTTAAPDCPQPRSVPETQKVLESSTAATGPDITSEPTSWMPQQKKETSAESVNADPIQKIIEQMEPPCKMKTKTNNPQNSGCCCLSLKTKIDHLEQLMQLQISLVKQLVGQTK